MAQEYSNSDIRSLKKEDRVRLKPEIMLGSSDVNGAFHTVKEMAGNSMDESRSGFGELIRLRWHLDGSVSVRDYGRGVPMDRNPAEDNRWNWDLIYNELYAGGKYNQDADADLKYKDPLGLNGLGGAVTQYTSEYMRVESRRDGKLYIKEFKAGVPVGADDLTELPIDDEPPGTYVRWKPDLEVFDDIDFGEARFLDYCQTQAYLTGVKIEFHNEYTNKTYLYDQGGLQNYLLSVVGESAIEVIYNEVTSTGLDHRGKKYRARAEIALGITNGDKNTQMHFHATSRMLSGSHPRAFDAAVLTFFREIGKKAKLKIVPYDYQDYLSIVTSTYSNIISFIEGQTKTAVSSQFIYDLVYNGVLDILEEGYAKQRAPIMDLVDNVLIAADARMRAKKVEEEARMAHKATQTRRGSKPAKLVDCITNDKKKIELFLVEGDSALGACKQARDSEYQQLLPIKGKPRNGIKSPLKKLLDNEEIKAIIMAIGAGVEVGGSELDLDNMNVTKVIITTDADSDGRQIRVLLYTVFCRLMPTLLRLGYIFIAETPLFEIKTKKEAVFAYTLEEKDAFLADFKERGIAVTQIKRSKGLGQNNPEMLSKSTMHPATRRLVPLTIDYSDELVRGVTDALFGLDKEGQRKDFVYSLLQQGVIDDASMALIEDMEKLDLIAEAESGSEIEISVEEEDTTATA